MSCTEARTWVSERLDGGDPPALSEHLDGCADCRHFVDRTEALRRSLRFEAVGTVPDIAGAVRAHLEADRSGPWNPRPATNDRFQNEGRGGRRGRHRSTIAVAAAALVAGVLIGVNLVGVGDDRPRPVAAESLPARIASAQATLDGLHADLRLVERGWNPAVPERRYQGTLDYRAPESLSLQWQDQTAYPSGAWRPNDVSLRTNGAAWVSTGVPDCRSFAQPDCSLPPRERSETGRPPFADSTPVPLELVVPVRSFTSADTATVVGEGSVAGRPTIEVTVAAAQVGPLLDSLRPAGNLRAVHPTDRVELSLDAERMVPLRLRVRASADPARQAWAVQQGYADQPGLVVLAMDVVGLDFAIPAADRFAPPAGAVVADAGFREGDPGLDLQPTAPEGFEVARIGRIEGPTPTGVWSWSDGRAWVRLQATEAWTGPRLFGDLGSLVRPRAMAGGQAYVSPDGRQVALHGASVDLVVDGSVATGTLLAVVDDLEVTSVPLPPDWPEQRSASPAAIRRALPGALGLEVPGFEHPAGRLDGDAAVLFTAGAGDRRLLLEQAPGTRIRPPTESNYETVGVRGVEARYTPGADRLEWVEDGAVLSLRGTGLTRAELVSVADQLEPL
ncbi:MAG: hypothetical protein ABWZ68_10695 [Acidimicrobiales bacterium]